MARSTHREGHATQRVGWLRAAVLGANDGIVSTASLIVGVAAAAASTQEILVAGMAGLVAGAMSMAAGEYVSVSSQRDSEDADLAREKRELAEDPEFELAELTQIYVEKGLEPALADQVARQLTAKDALKIHAAEELGLSEMTTAKPVQAAFSSALAFGVGAALPLVAGLVSPASWLSWIVPGVALVSLAILGAVGARAGGADPVRAAIRVTFWGAAAMAITAAIGALFGTVV